MPLAIGSKLGPYEILAPIGAGGMGEVYKARDTKLGREVAIKVLPEAFAENKERLARFEREARLLASLNHPNIATLFDLHEHDDFHFLVLEFVPGETLAERIRRGAIPIEEILPLFKQIAEALEAAHENGVIHRDLKPANVKVTPEGKVKVLDFGLAKAFSDESPSSDLSQSPTMTREETRAGVIMGTASYMSPDQARGKELDKRTDIWAFGCCLYEALTSRKAFGGETVTDVIATIVKSEPSWEYLPSNIPLSVVKLLRRCLQKDPSLRLRDIGEARIILDRDVDTSSDVGFAASFEHPKTAWAPWALVGVMAMAIAFLSWTLMRESAGPGPIAHFLVETPPEGLQGGPPAPTVAISRDGSQVALVGSRLYLRSINDVEAKPLPGTENGYYPFFSPDGAWIGFFADGKLKKISTRGGPAQVLCEAAQGGGGYWGPDDTIVFTPTFASALFRVSASGGEPEPVTVVRDGEMAHFYPHVLPGGKEVLFTSVLPLQKIEIASLETGKRELLLEDASMPSYSPTGHLVFVRQRTLMAIPFDLDRRENVGSPEPLFEGIWQSSINCSASYALSDNGTLVYVTDDPPRESSLVSVDRQGSVRELVTRPGLFYFPQVSPDGKRIAVTLNSGTPSYSAWIYDLERGTLSLLDEGGMGAVWTPDGGRITFSKAGSIYWKPSDGSGESEPLLARPLTQVPNSWSPDGNVLAYSEFHPETGLDLWIYPSDGEPAALFNSSFDEFSGRFSRDGKYLAFVSDESGRREVYVTQYPEFGGKWQISTQGGAHPVWSWDGRHIHYRNLENIYSVAIETDPEFAASEPEVIYSGPLMSAVAIGVPYYDVSPDGEQVFLVHAAGHKERKPRQVHVVLNWSEELERLVLTN